MSAVGQAILRTCLSTLRGLSSIHYTDPPKIAVSLVFDSAKNANFAAQTIFANAPQNCPIEVEKKCPFSSIDTVITYKPKTGSIFFKSVSTTQELIGHLGKCVPGPQGSSRVVTILKK
ncbi:MAG: hypothetical protein V4487_08520 [Chlamydiota bacterium]